MKVRRVLERNSVELLPELPTVVTDAVKKNEERHHKDAMSDVLTPAIEVCGNDFTYEYVHKLFVTVFRLFVRIFIIAGELFLILKTLMKLMKNHNYDKGSDSVR